MRSRRSGLGSRQPAVMANVDDWIETQPGTYVTMPIRALAVYVREGGTWKLVHSHTSAAAPNA